MLTRAAVQRMKRYCLILIALLHWHTGHAAAGFMDTMERTLQVPGRARLTVTNSDGGTTITAGEPSQVRIKGVKMVRGAVNEAEERQYASKVQIRIAQTGDRIGVEVKYPKGGSFAQETPRVLVHLEIAAPASSEVTARATNGQIQVSGFRGRLDLFTTDGELSVERCSGLIKARSADGDLTIQDARGEIEARTAGGSLKAAGILEGLEAQSKDGKIEIRVLPGSIMKQDWTIRGANGGVRLYLPDGFAAELDVTTSDAEIILDQKLDIDGSLEKRRLTGKLGGGGKLLLIHSSEGDVRILRWHPLAKNAVVFPLLPLLRQHHPTSQTYIISAK